MGFLSRFEKKDLSTADGAVASPKAIGHDLGDRNLGEHEYAGNGLTTASPHITPKMEKHLVRKLDRRLVPLVMGLCMCIYTGIRAANVSLQYLDVLAFLDRSNIGSVVPQKFSLAILLNILEMPKLQEWRKNSNCHLLIISGFSQYSTSPIYYSSGLR